MKILQFFKAQNLVPSEHFILFEAQEQELFGLRAFFTRRRLLYDQLLSGIYCTRQSLFQPKTLRSADTIVRRDGMGLMGGG